jgi:hypothetical protein
VSRRVAVVFKYCLSVCPDTFVGVVTNLYFGVMGIASTIHSVE